MTHNHQPFHNHRSLTREHTTYQMTALYVTVMYAVLCGPENGCYVACAYMGSTDSDLGGSRRTFPAASTLNV